jgi:hypothetical protein
MLLFCLPFSALHGQVLYVVAAGNLRDDLFAAEFQAGITFFTSLFVENLPAENLMVYNAPGSRWTGDDISTAPHPMETLKAVITDCPAESNDGILVFWFGNGGMVKGEFLFFVKEPMPTEKDALEDKIEESPDGNGGEVSEENPDPQATERNEEKGKPKLVERRVSRNELTLALKEKKVRFAGLITDSSRQFKRVSEEKTIRYIPNPSEITSLMSSLFFEPRGFLDINSCCPKQSSLLNGIYGSLMVGAFGEFLETCDYEAVRWTELIDAVNGLMRERSKAYRQRIDLFSVPKELRPESQSSEGSSPAGHHRHSAERWRDDWDEIARRVRARLHEMPEEVYPRNYDTISGRFRSVLWSPPLYYPEAGDLLIGINGQRILGYHQFLDAIQASPDLIYLTVIDHRTGFVYEMRTVMGPPGPHTRLGLAVVEDPWGGVRVTGSVLGSPASRCQYLIGYEHWRYAPFGVYD